MKRIKAKLKKEPTDAEFTVLLISSIVATLGLASMFLSVVAN